MAPIEIEADAIVPLTSVGGIAERKLSRDHTNYYFLALQKVPYALGWRSINAGQGILYQDRPRR